MKTGRWKVHFDVTLDGVGIDFDELPASEKRRIQRLLAFGTVAGEVTALTTGEGGPWVGDIVRLNFGGRMGKTDDATCGSDGRVLHEIVRSDGYRDRYHRDQYVKPDW